MRLIFLNRYFHPDHSATSQMLSDLAFDLAKVRSGVTVITSRQIYDAPDVKLPAFESVNGVAVYRVWTSGFGRQRLSGRAADYASFYVSAAWVLWRLARRGDVVVAKTDPPMISVVAALICAVRSAELINWLQDIFPEVAEALGIASGRLARFGFPRLRAVRDWSLRRAAMNVAIGELMAARLVQSGIPEKRIRVVQNWADGARIRPIAASNNRLRQAWGLSGKFVVGYSGNLGRAHEFDTLIDAVAEVEAQYRVAGFARKRVGDANENSLDAYPEIVWLFVGGGALIGPFKSALRARGLTSVQFQPYQPREHLAESLSAADIHVISLRRVLEGLIVPSKFYGVAAAGRPAIYIGDTHGEVPRLLAEHRCGLAVAEGNGAALAAAILDLAGVPLAPAEMGARARTLFEREFDKPVAFEKWFDLLHEVEAARAIGIPRQVTAKGET